MMAKKFKKHMMYHPKTGVGTMANTMDDHLRMKRMGYTHSEPNKKMTRTSKSSY
jgi:hypothetical protein